MLAMEPPPTAGDLHFRAAGIPVRVHPFFWIALIFLGISGGSRETPPLQLLVWVATASASILVHELGHALVQRRYGERPRITLYAFGGMATSDGGARSPGRQLAISLAGPSAGFLVAFGVLAALRASGCVAGVTTADAISAPREAVVEALSLAGAKLYWEVPSQPAAALGLRYLMFVNVFWGLVNLLPIFPLDGGRVALELCQLACGSRRGILASLQISLAAAALAACYGLARQSLMTAVFFGYLAYQSYRLIEAYRGRTA